MAFLAPSEQRVERLNLRFDAVKSPHSLRTIFEGNVYHELDQRWVHTEFGSKGDKLRPEQVIH